MPTVEKNIIKEWFRNLKKPDQDQFWSWLDSFYHKLEGIAIDGITGLQDALNKKADLVNGVVPENQLPFTVNTNEVINIGLIEVTANNVKINVHESGSNKVRINGQIIERSFVNNLPFTAVSEGNKFLRIVARNEPGLFFLKQSAESDEPQEPTLGAGEIHVRLILVTPDGSYIDPQLLNGFKTKSEDTWKTEFPNKLGNFALNYTDERTCFSLETQTPSATTKTLQLVNFGVETTRDVQFTIKNNTLGSVVIPALASDGLLKGFVDNTPFTIPSKGTVFAKYNHVRNIVEILKAGSTVDLSGYATQAGLDAEIVNRAAADSNLQTQITSINNQKSSAVDKMLHYWDATTTKWLSAGIYYLSSKIGIGTTSPAEMLEVNGRIKSNSIVLGSDIGTAVPNELGRKSGLLCAADASGVLRYYSAGSRFVYTPTGNFTMSALKTAVEAVGMIFNSIVIYVNLGSNNYTCTIDIGASNTNTSGVILRSGTGSLSFASIRTLDSGVSSITILNGNQSSYCAFILMDKDYVKIKNN